MLWFKGRGLAKFTVTLSLYNQADWQAWRGFEPVVRAVPFGRRAGFLPIVHPLLNAQKIDKVVVTNLHQPEPTDDGIWRIKIDFLQYRRWRLRLSKPDTPKPDKLTDTQALIVARTAQGNALAAGVAAQARRVGL